MVIKEGKIPVNARVDVDYSGKEPKVKFGYTGKNPKKDSVKQNAWGIHTIILAILLAIILWGTSTYFSEEIRSPENCSVDFDVYESNYSLKGYRQGEPYNYSFDYKAVYGFNLTCDSKTEYYDYIGYKNPLTQDSLHFYRPMGTKYLLFLLIVLLMYAIYFVTLYFSGKLLTKYLVKQKWYQKWYPKHQAGGLNKKKKYYKFKPKDVLDNVIVIPQFNNVELTYKTDKDFDKYLRKIRIREYRHNVYKKQKVGKLKVNNYKWYAVFYFDQQPKDGFLEVIFQ